MPTITHRFRGAALTAVLLLGTLGAPLADAAFFHLAGQDPCAGTTHIEAHGNQHHADRCVLARPIVAQRESLGSAEAVRIAPPMATPAIADDTRLPADAAFFTLQHSRAPPA